MLCVTLRISAKLCVIAVTQSFAEKHRGSQRTKNITLLALSFIRTYINYEIKKFVNSLKFDF